MNPNTCPICNSPNLKELFYTKDTAGSDIFLIKKCPDCLVSHTSPMPKTLEMGSYYKDEYYGEDSKKFNKLFEKLIIVFRRLRASFVMNIKSSGTVLDIGCGRGWMLSILSEKGFDVIGTEFTESSARFAKDSLNLDIKTGELTELDIKEASIDVVTMWHSFEHMYEPKAVLSKVYGLLKEDGKLFIAVPNFASLQSRISKGKWFHLDAPRHLYHFTPQSLEKLLVDSGFKVESVSFTSLEYNLFGAVQSLYNTIGMKVNLLYDIIRDPTAKLTKSSFVGNLVGGLFIALLAPLVFPIALLETLITDFTPYGATINIVAHKGD